MTGLREAGAAIAGAGHVDNATRATEADIATRRTQANGRSDAEPRRPVQSDPVETDEDDAGPDDGIGDDAEQSTPDAEDDDGNGDEQSEDGSDDATPTEAMHTVKIDGKTSQVTTSELIAGYQRGKDYSNKTHRLSATARTLQEGHAKAAEMMGQQISRAQAIVARVKADLAGDMNSQAMRDLRKQDFAQWQQVRAEYEDRAAQVDQYLHAIQQEMEGAAQQTKEQKDAHMRAILEQERERVLVEIPDWAEAKSGEPGSARVMNYLMGAGYTVAELDALIDSRAIIIADKARRYDDLMAKQAKAAKQPAKPAPKHIPAGGGSVARKPQVGARRDYQDAKARAAKTGDMRDAATAINKLFRT